MKLHLQVGNDRENLIRAYNPGEIIINKQVYTASVIISATQLIEGKLPSQFQDLSISHMDFITQQAPEIVILGTGESQHFPPPSLLRPLIDAAIGYEVMTTAAACRTYNVLMGEGRNVIAALLL